MEKRGMLICFTISSRKFKSNSERNKFFRGLYGWKQVIEKDGRRYEYERQGMLDEIPHKKVDQSSFIVEDGDFKMVDRFFDDWAGKVMHNTFKVLLDKSIFQELEDMRSRIEEEMEEEEEDEDFD